MNNYNINQALIAHLLTLTGLPLVVYENTPSSDADKFLTVSDIPVDDVYFDFCNTSDKTGIFQIDVYVRRDVGSKEAIELSDKISNHFKFIDLDGVIITKSVIEAAITTDRYYRKPISIYYRNIS